MKDIFTGPGSPVSSDGFAGAVARIGIAGEEASLWSVLAVETRGFGFLPDRRPKILFERHVFHRRTGGRFSGSHPDISNPATGGYSGGAREYDRLKRAMVLDRAAALESASWGLGQVMGFNARSIGYAGVDAMVDAFVRSEDAQLEGCARFIAANPALSAALKARAWARVAFFYNGRSYAEQGYDRKLGDFHTAYSKGPLPAVEVRAAQARLSYLGFDPGGIDGVFGGGTRRAMQAFQQANGLPVTPALDSATEEKLEEAAGA
jgi:hypothetical protein